MSEPIEERPEGAFATLRRGLRMMPEFRRGLPATFALALVATAGRVRSEEHTSELQYRT